MKPSGDCLSVLQLAKCRYGSRRMCVLSAETDGHTFVFAFPRRAEAEARVAVLRWALDGRLTMTTEDAEHLFDMMDYARQEGL